MLFSLENVFIRHVNICRKIRNNFDLCAHQLTMTVGNNNIEESSIPRAILKLEKRFLCNGQSECQTDITRCNLKQQHKHVMLTSAFSLANLD